MPNRYLYRKMTQPEFLKAMRRANLSVSDACKLLGRRFYTIKNYMGQGDPSHKVEEPTALESVVMDFVAEYPDTIDALLHMAEQRITGQAMRTSQIEKEGR